MTARAQRRMLNEVKKNPRVSARDLKKSLAHANISVDESTIRKTLNKNGVHGRTPRRKPLLSRKNIAARNWLVLNAVISRSAVAFEKTGQENKRPSLPRVSAHRSLDYGTKGMLGSVY
ncbi:hypothetical protein JOQ06_020345 [Pogonophryne albipinna]|uniref:Transposase Tc1-like domain-containing protein n=1 Tax=Pogonophryne albipinna TaxID=1090488 RepID=A0AAD6BRC6_9TELE|nr:hypothetical protein JOQ06_020345 [Pogonophryne albipinna]